MPYITSITNTGVSVPGDGTYVINFLVVINNGTEDIFSISIDGIYDPKNPDIDQIKANILSEVRKEWDTFMLASNIENSAALESAISDMKTQADNYINQ